MKMFKITAVLLFTVFLCIAVLTACYFSYDLFQACCSESRHLLDGISAGSVQPHRIHFPN